MTGVNGLIGQSSKVTLLFILAFVALDLTPANAFDDRYPPLGDYRHPFRITERYEKIRDHLTTKLDFKDAMKSSEHHVDISVMRFSSGAKRTTGGVSVNFYSHSTGGWKYLKFHDIAFLVDDERWSFDPKHDGDVGDGYVTESFWLDLTETRFLKLVNAKSVDIAFGGDKFAFDLRHLKALKDFASLLNSPDVDLANRPPQSPRVAIKIDKKTIPAGQGVVAVGDELQRCSGALSLDYFDEVDRLMLGPPEEYGAFLKDQIKKSNLLTVDYGIKFRVIQIKNRPHSIMEKKLGVTIDRRIVQGEVLEGEHKGSILWFSCFNVENSPNLPIKDVISKQAESTIRIAKSHDKDGRKKLAIAAYKEVVDKFPETPQAEQAKLRLLEIDK